MGAAARTLLGRLEVFGIVASRGSGRDLVHLRTNLVDAAQGRRERQRLRGVPRRGRGAKLRRGVSVRAGQVGGWRRRVWPRTSPWRPMEQMRCEQALRRRWGGGQAVPKMGPGATRGQRQRTMDQGPIGPKLAREQRARTEGRQCTPAHAQETQVLPACNGGEG